MATKQLIVASLDPKEAVTSFRPSPKDRHIVELRIVTNASQRQTLTQLFDCCHAYQVRCTQAANELLASFWQTPACQRLLKIMTQGKNKHRTATAKQSYRQLRETHQLHAELPFTKQLVTRVLQQATEAELPNPKKEIPAHIAQRIEYAVWQAANQKLSHPAGRIHYPSYSAFRVIEGKNNHANITFDPRPNEMKLTIDGEAYPVTPLRNSDFVQQQPLLAQAYVAQRTTLGAIHYCRVIRRYVNNHGQIEWGYWLQLVVKGQPPLRKNTPAVATPPAVA